MRSFKDSTGALWEVSINIGTVKRVKALLKDDAGKPVDLSRLLEDGFKGYAALLGDLSLFVDVLYVICKPQADREGVSDVQFGEAFGGDTLEVAADAFREELIDFFPASKARGSLRKVMDKGREVGLKMLEQEEANLATLDVEKEATAIRAAIGSSTSAALTPAS